MSGDQHAGCRNERSRPRKTMPYWSIYCVFCQGYISDALLECVPATKRSGPAFALLFHTQPGAALACPYCNGLLGFDGLGQPRGAESGWRVFRYGEAELRLKKQADGEADSTSLAEWAIRQRFTQPGTHEPLKDYIYAEQAPAHETVP